MTIDEIRSSFPNGFHDSYLLNINLDYANEMATLLFQIVLSSAADSVKVIFRSGHLKLSGLLYFAIEPPSGSFTKEYVPGDDRMWITSDTSDFSSLTFSDVHPRPRLPEPLPDQSFQHFFYSSSHNSCIYLAAMDASFEWVDEPK